MRRWVAWFTTLILLIPVVAVAAPPIGNILQQWMDQTDDRLADLEARVAALEGATSSTVPSTTSSTTSTTQPSTTTTTQPTTTTTQPTTTTTAPTTTTTAPTTTTTVVPTTTTTAGPGDLNLPGDMLVTGTFSFSGHIEGNGHQIVVDGGSLDWDGVTVNNVSRIIHRGGCGVSSIRNTVVSNSGTPELGFYPLHWHLCGDTTRGTLLENVTVVNGQNHAFVPHGSHGISFLNVTARNIIKAAFWWDPEGTNPNRADSSNDILIDGLLVDGVDYPRSLLPCCAGHHRVSGVVLGAGSGNIIRNSHVQNVSGGSDRSAYHWPEDANMVPNVWVFDNNTSSNTGHGIFVWQNDFNPHVITNFSGGGISHGAYTNRYHYQNVDVPYTIVHATGWTMADSDAGAVTLVDHQIAGPVVWDNVLMDSLTVNEPRSDLEGLQFAATTNLSCADVVWVQKHPDTTVTLNGVACNP